MATATVKPNTATLGSFIEKNIPDPKVIVSSFKSEEKKETTEHFNNWPNACGFETDYEQRTPIELKVTGIIPSYAAGVLYRTGPSNYKAKTKDDKELSMSHWFDGWTQVHRFEIQPSAKSNSSTKVLYNSRRSVDSMVERMRETGDMGAFTFGQKRDPCQSFFQKVMSTFSPIKNMPTNGKPDANNVGVSMAVNMPGLPGPHGSIPPTGPIKTLVNKTDANAYQYIDPETLEPAGVTNQTVLHPSLTGPLAATHAKTDPLTGDVFNYNLDISRITTYRIFCASASTGKTSILATITDAPPAYLHSLFITETTVILCVWGSHFSYKGLSILYNKNVIDSLSPTDPSSPCLWYVIDRTPAMKGVLAVYTSPAFFSFHTVNASEIISPTTGAKSITADLVTYPDLSVLHRFYYENLLSNSPAAKALSQSPKGFNSKPAFARYRLEAVPSTPEPKRTEAILEWKAPLAHSAELPTINTHFLCRPHRYIYGSTYNKGGSTFLNTLVKFDTTTQTSLFWHHQGQSPGEAIFVPNPDASEGPEGEDDGLLLSVVLDGFAERSYLLVLDGKTFEEVGRAELPVGGIVGLGFHGIYVGAGKETACEV
ncbi:MAG: hypothetical protein MMC33_002923 [Icmadophila ericetorum]|nr:hypothetical protein [Icmadophila ericetorum]